MKLVTFRVAGPLGAVDRLGALIDGHQDGRIADLTVAYCTYLAAETDEPTPEGLAQLRTPPDMIGWLKGGHKSLAAAEKAVAYARRRLEQEVDPRSADGAKLVYDANAIRLMAPLPRPNSLRDFSIYFEHMMRAGKRTEKPSAWFKTPPFYKGSPETVVGPDAPVPFPYYTKKLDLEIEIAIVIGKKGRNLTFEEARKHIAGYSIWIDPSARDHHEREPFGPTKRKDFCTGLGPCLVTADEIDPENLAVKVSVDGETWFEGNTNAARSFHVEQLVAYASDNETLYPGDVIGTGTIGYGCAMDYHKWVEVGQTMTFEVEGIGRMIHKIVPGEHVVDHVNGMKGLIAPPAAAGSVV
jgi:2-keto-4-pentenoate hydratase/2-oxohepta-3-ene-1,7-dioic acid hydratase in catechol pathway